MILAVEAIRELWQKYKTIFTEAWAQRHVLEPVERLPHEYAFLPATLALQETPVHPAPRWAMRLILGFVCLCLLWATFGRLDVVASATGKVVPDSRSKTIQPFETAIVKAIYVKDGSLVKSGDELITLDTTVAQAEMDRVSHELEMAVLDSLMYRALISTQELQQKNKENIRLVLSKDALPTEFKSLDLQAQQYLATAEYNAYVTRAAQLDMAISRHEAEQRSTQALVEKYEQTLPIVQQKEQDYRSLLSKNYVSQHDYLELKKGLIEQERDLASEREKLTEITASKMEAERESKQFYAEMRKTWMDKLHESEQHSAALSQELIKANIHGNLMHLTAPVDGKVQQLAVHTIGGVVTPAQAVMIIVPSNTPIEIEAYVSNQDIGFVHENQEVEIKIETYSYTKYGTIKGVVSSVSSDAIKDEKLGLVFPVRIELEKDTLMVDGKSMSLSPGMVVTAEIKTTQRRVIEYFLDPLMRHSNESLHER